MNPLDTDSNTLRKRTLVVIILICLFALAARIAVVNERPMHADEATQAYIFADLLEHGSYTYDPTHHHGPAAHLVHFIFLRPFGIDSLDQLQAWQFRMQGIILGTLCAFFAAVTVFRNKRAAVFAALLSGTSPLLFYFSGMAIPETLLGLLALGIPLLVAHTLKNKTDVFACILIGLLLGLLLATKETWGIIGLSWLVALLILYPRYILPVARNIGIIKLLIVTLSGLLAAAVLYTNFYRNPQGAPDAIRTFFIYETSPLHNKAWYYYLSDLILPRVALGSFTGEIILFVLAIFALGLAIFRKKGNTPHPLPASLSTFLCVAGLVQLLIYSIIPYKTPWLLLVPILYLVPAAAVFLSSIKYGWLSYALALLLVAANLHQVIATSFFHPTSNDNPYAYAPTLPEAEANLKALNEELPREALIAVVGSDYWPVPWYFRQRRSTVGYYDKVPENTAPFSLILYTKEAFYDAPSDLPPGISSIPFSLRSGTYIDAQLKLDLR